MNTPLFAVVLSCVGMPALLLGQTRASAADRPCVKSLELPTRGLLAAGAGSSGTVVATVLIAKDGSVQRLDLTGGNRVLQGEVRVAIGLSKFDSVCQGQNVEFIFAFTLEDPPTDAIIPPAVQFLPPNRFELTFRRLKPRVD